MHDLGPSALIEVHAPETLWKTVQPPVAVSLPLTFANRNPFRKVMPAVCVMFVAMLISIEVFAFWIVVVVGEQDITLRLKGMYVLLLAAGFMPFLRVMYYNGVVNSLAAGDCLYVGIDGFVDTRLLEEPIVWTNVIAVEPICDKGGVIGAKLKLKQPCSFTKKFKSSFPMFFLINIETIEM